MTIFDGAGAPHDEDDLENQLSTPSPAVAAALLACGGDIVVLGAGGKVGPSLCRMARRALDEAGSPQQVIAVSRWGDADGRRALDVAGIRTVAADLADPDCYPALPDAGAVFFLAGNKFGSSRNTHLTWWMNAVVPGLAAARYRGVPTVVYSSGNVYPFVAAHTGGCRESDPVGPVGAYAQSCLAREQAYTHAAALWSTPVSIFRLNYAVELRYGVLADIASKILADEPVDVTMAAVNVVWQRDCVDWSLRCLVDASADTPFVLNATGPETLSTRSVAHRLAGLLGRDVQICGVEAEGALLSDASMCHARYGYPQVTADAAIGWVAEWVGAGGRLLGKATKFQQRDGQF